MSLIIKLLVTTSLLCVGAAAQERIRTAKVGAYGDQTRVIIALVDPVPEGYKMRSMIIDLTPLRKKQEEPSETHLDLTSTVRAVVTGSRDQKILILNWKKNGPLTAKCDGDWKEQERTPAFEKIINVTQAVIQIVPSTPKEPKDFELPSDIEQKIIAIFDSLNAESVPCLRQLH